MPLRIPPSLKEEHEELHADLAHATKAGGRTGQAALSLVRIMRPHFRKEEEYALPPLSPTSAEERSGPRCPQF